MSVLIKGITMPKNCCDCPCFNEFGYHFCNLDDERRDVYYGRPEWCMIAEFPEKHGRLIDENDVIHAIHDRLHELQTHKEFAKKHGDIDLLGVLPYIAKIQSVIEAEDEQ